MEKPNPSKLCFETPWQLWPDDGGRSQDNLWLQKAEDALGTSRDAAKECSPGVSRGKRWRTLKAPASVRENFAIQGKVRFVLIELMLPVAVVLSFSVKDPGEVVGQGRQGEFDSHFLQAAQAKLP
jgi:hypothetical protein